MTPEAFRTARKLLRLTQAEMALALRLSESRTVRRYEDGSREIAGPTEVAVGYMLRHGLLPAADQAIRDRRKALRR